MGSRSASPTLAALLLVLVWGCGDAGEVVCDCISRYPENLSEPDSLMEQFLLAYKQREIEPYRELLAQDFAFRFQERDIDQLGPTLDRTQDALSTETMFASSDVVEVRLAMVWRPATDEMWEGEPAKRIVLADLLLDVEQSSNVTLRVAGQTQHFYFRPGKAEFGEDTGRYYLVGWQDAGSGTFAHLGAPVEEISWGLIKRLYLPLPEASRGSHRP